MEERKFGHFGWLLMSLAILLLLTPFSQLLHGPLPRARVLYTIVLLAGVHSLRRDPWMFRGGFALALVALVTGWLTQHWDLPALVIADHLLTAAFLGLTTVLILATILTAYRVTLDTVLGGICVYLLLGVLWVSLYSALEYAIPGSFVAGDVPISALSHSGTEAHRFPRLLYFSFVTLTTLGYGDIVPTNPLAHALATGEAILGQVYLAVFVASLVGLHLAHRTRDETPLP